MNAVAVILEQPEQLVLGPVALSDLGPADLLVEITSSGISTGTERLLWTGRMPMFPGMGYPLIPGYESVGIVRAAGPDANIELGTTVFVPGARWNGPVRGLFGGAASRVVVPAQRVTPIGPELAETGVLLALAATAYHALAAPGAGLPDLIVGHGVLGRLLARIATALADQPPTVWERNVDRHAGAEGYAVVVPETDARADYRAIYDVSGDSALLDTLIGRLSRGGEVVLAGFYEKPLSFQFPPAFMKEARIRAAAEWQPADLAAVLALVNQGRLSLDGLITHTCPAADAARAYRTAFNDPACLKMVLDWRAYA
jgi:3-hydroxyethyl bacteriochlorophyllide a dehydrogenase